MIRKNLRWMAAVLLAVNLVVAMPTNLMAQLQKSSAVNFRTTTPIKHLVVIFQENVSFDHYFASYPNAQNIEGETQFHAKKDTPAVNGLTGGLTAANPNTDYPPFRLDPAQNYTCSQNHDYTHEQQAFDSGLMDKFPEFTANVCSTYPDVADLGAAIVMGWFDGNTVTAEWNYAQHFAMDQNFFGTNFGPSTVGAINVVSGMTGNVDLNHLIPGTGFGDDITYTNDGKAASVTGDPDPYWDDCGSPDQASVLGNNIGDLLNTKKITWGWFQGGFTPSTVVGGIAQCSTTTNRIDGMSETAYSAHHNPFAYYFSTKNVHHTPPANLSEIGHGGAANHQYDLSYFWKVVDNGDLPAVSYLKANRAQDGHPGNSSPLDEQQFIVKVINKLQASPEWDSTAVIITYDDSDGWYDHVIGPIVNTSATANDALTGAGMCGTGASSLAGIQARCGYGPRIPFIVVSPFAKDNFVDSTLTDQSSVVRFIEDNWDLGRIGPGSFDQIAGPITNMFDFKHPRTDRVILDPVTGQVVN